MHRGGQPGLDRVQSDVDRYLVYHVRKDPTKRPDAIILCIDNELVVNARTDHPNTLLTRVSSPKKLHRTDFRGVAVACPRIFLEESVSSCSFLKEILHPVPKDVVCGLSSAIPIWKL